MQTSQDGGKLKVLYLDFDGPMHPADVVLIKGRPAFGRYAKDMGCTLFQHQNKLAEVLEEFPRVKIVLSTHWVFRKGFSYAKSQLTEELQKRVIGATFHSSMKQGWLDNTFVDVPRYLQIVGDLTRRRPDNWVAVDDDADGWPDVARDKLVYVDPVKGLGESEKLLELWQHFSNWETNNKLV